MAKYKSKDVAEIAEACFYAHELIKYSPRTLLENGFNLNGFTYGELKEKLDNVPEKIVEKFGPEFRKKFYLAKNNLDSILENDSLLSGKQ